MMTEEDLRNRLAEGEGPLCEFKANIGGEEVRECVVAFANSVRAPDEGVLFVGVNPSGDPSGAVEDADAMQRRLGGLLRKCYPLVESVQYRPLVVKGMPVVAVVVSESRSRPHFTGPACVRVGSETREANVQMFEELIADRTDAARLLRLWVGRDIRVIREYDPGVGIRRWPDNPALLRLERIDAIGLAVRADGWPAPVLADWRRVALQPTEPGESPLVRIALG